jgi:uncharacterized coiled-coil DUF342 family protein
MLDELEKELAENLKVAENIKDTIRNYHNQIEGLNNKGKEVSYHCTYLRGRIDMLKELEKR